MRDGAREALDAFSSANVNVALLSGDAPDRVATVAQALGLRAEGVDAQVLAAATPEAKLAALSRWQARGEVVAMVGDGVNDVPVMAKADVSLAMGGGAGVTQRHADAVVLADGLQVLPQLMALSRRSIVVMRRNLIWAAAYNAACIPLAVMGWLPPWAAGLGMALSSTFVILHAQSVAVGPLAKLQAAKG
jgi:Cu2+-exporting ATPase